MVLQSDTFITSELTLRCITCHNWVYNNYLLAIPAASTDLTTFHKLPNMVMLNIALQLCKPGTSYIIVLAEECRQQAINTESGSEVVIHMTMA